MSCSVIKWNMQKLRYQLTYWHVLFSSGSIKPAAVIHTSCSEVSRSVFLKQTLPELPGSSDWQDPDAWMDDAWSSSLEDDSSFILKKGNQLGGTTKTEANWGDEREMFCFKREKRKREVTCFLRAERVSSLHCLHPLQSLIPEVHKCQSSKLV